MKRPARILAIIVGAFAALILLLFLGLQIFLNSGKARQMIDKFAAEAIDGKLEYSCLRFDAFKAFPGIRISLDDVALTYPHERFSEWDGHGPASPVLEMGRGSDADTLAAFRRFTAAANPWRLLNRRLRLNDANIDGLRAYARVYPDGSANWQMFGDPNKEKDTLKKGLSLPPLSLGPIRIKDRPQIVYTSLRDTLYAQLEMREMSLKGALTLPDKDKSLQVRGLRFLIDSLQLSARLPSDSLALDLEHLNLHTPRRNFFDLDAAAMALLAKAGKGPLEIPVELKAQASYSKEAGVTQIDVPSLALSASDIPLKGNGNLKMYGDSSYVKAGLEIIGAALGTNLQRLADAGYLPFAKKFSTSAALNLTADAEGVLSHTQLPAAKAQLSIAPAAVKYRPMNLDGTAELDLDAKLTPQKMLSANLKKLGLSSEGANLALTGTASDLLGKDPSFVAHLSGDADLSALRRYLSDSVRLSGLVDLRLDADSRLSEVRQLNFRKGSVNGQLNSPGIRYEKPYDSLSAVLDECKITLASQEDGLKANIGIDSVSFDKGGSLQAKLREMVTRADISKVVSGGKWVPRIEVSSDNSRVYFRSGDNRIGTSELHLSATLQKRAAVEDRQPGNTGAEEAPDNSGDEFAGKDIKLNLGKSVADFLRAWSPSAGIVAKSGYYATPRLPLRNRIRSVNLQYNDDAFDLHEMEVSSGTSDLALSGKISGLRRTLLGNGFLKGDLRLNSGRLNLNEFLTALKVGREIEYETMDETDESFVTDTLANASYKRDSSMKVIVVPANLDASLSIHANNVDYSDVAVSPLDAQIKVARRCIQLTDTKLTTNLGNVALDAFYASRNKQDIQLGADLQLIDMSAASIIHMLPSVDRMIPAMKSFRGSLGCRVSLTSQLDTMMNVLIPTVDGLVRVTGRNLEVKDAGKLRKITRLLLFKDKNIGHIDDLAVDAVIEKSKVEIYPFILGVDRYQLALMGVQGLDKTMRYNVTVLKGPVFPIRFGINIFGTLDDFHYSLGRSKYRRGEVPVFRQEIDDIQYNIGDAIRNVFEKGVDNAVAATMQGYVNLQRRKKELGYDNTLPKDFLSNSEYQQLEAKAFEEEMKQYDAEVDAEVEAALAESAKK